MELRKILVQFEEVKLELGIFVEFPATIGDNSRLSFNAEKLDVVFTNKLNVHPMYSMELDACYFLHNEMTMKAECSCFEHSIQ